MRILRVQSLAVCTLTITLTACSILQPQPDPSRFFVLTPSTPAATAQVPNAPRIGLGPIEFPAYLQRPQMVTRASTNEIVLSEIHRWGEALDVNFARVLAQDLVEILGSDRVVSYPWYSTQGIDHAIRIDVAQFDVGTSGEARLLARWRIVNTKSDKVIRAGLADLQQHASDSSPDAAVAALSKLVEKLSDELAVGLDALRH